jgi:hypothetical protein
LRTIEARVAIVAGFVLEHHLHDAIRANVGEWVDQHGVNDAEDGGGGADTQREREDGGERETGAFAKFAGGIAEVGD